MPNETRYEIDHQGQIVEKETELCADLNSIIEQLFSQNGWTYQENDKSGSFRNITITNASNNQYTLNVYSGTIRNERRNPYEKKIQLSGKDPRAQQDQDTIILGVYVFNANDRLADAIIVGYPIDNSINYDTNPSLRGVFADKILQQAKLKGFVVDASKNLVAFRPEFIFYYLDHYKQIHYNVPVDADGLEDIEDAGDENALLPIKFTTGYKSKFDHNRIVFGAPGTGKSNKLKCDGEELIQDTTGSYERVTFHPDYAYSHFVGAYKPVTDNAGEIRYEFVPGPFMRVYVGLAE